MAEPSGPVVLPAPGRRVGRVRRPPAVAALRADTVTICFSTTKGVASTVIHRLADRGLVYYEAPVASYWPKFAVAEEQAITVRQLLSNRAGLHSMIDLVDRFVDSSSR